MAQLPPGPSNAALQTLRYMRDPFGYYGWLRQHFDDPVTLPSFAGSLVVTGHPEGAKDVLSADPSYFDVFVVDNLGMVFPPLSIPILNGEPHQRERKLLMPQFHSARTRGYARAMQETALRHGAKWKKGEPFVMQAAAKDISLEVLLRNVFGVTDPQEIQRMEECIVEVVRRTTDALIFFRHLRHNFGGIGPYAAWKRARDRLDVLIYDLIARRRATPDSPAEDVLNLMLSARYEDGSAMSDQGVHDELFALLFAGHAAVGTGMAWAFYWIHKHPEVLNKLREELSKLPADASPEAFNELSYLDAVCNETLRIYPPVPDLYRQVRQPLKVRGYTLPVGTGVSVYTNMIHLREDIFPEPLRFRPERFLERKFSPFEFIPFGVGARRCIGATFAIQEMKIVLGTILRTFELELVDNEERAVRQGLGMGPKRGVRMRLVRRLDA